VDPDQIPLFDVLCAGFPCQPFSHAGLKKGFEDTRGTLFFNIAEIVNKKKINGTPPRVLLLENVKGLKNHDKGKTMVTILKVLEDLGYYVNYKVLNTKYFGLPQNRERLFIVAWLKTQEAPREFMFPIGIDHDDKIISEESQLATKSRSTKLGDILLSEVDNKYTISDKLYNGHKRRLIEHKEKGNGFGFSLFDENSKYTSTISARYYKDGSEILIKQGNKNPRKLSPFEAGLLQGYPMNSGFRLVVSDVQAYKQFGNSVSVPVVTALAKEISKQLL
jgi:DNA (cytosine-5)-methyltransferase 1